MSLSARSRHADPGLLSAVRVGRLASMVKRQRTVVAALGSSCAYCNGSDVVLMESRNVRRPQDWLNRNWHEHLRRYERCSDCGARLLLLADGEALRGAGPATAETEAVRLVG